MPARSRPDWLAPLAGALTALVGIANVASAVTPDLTDRARALGRLKFGDAVPVAHALALPLGVALLVLAFYLGRRRRRAWRIVLAVLLAAGVVNVVKGLDVEEAVLNLALAGLLVWGRSSFYVRHERESLRDNLAAAAVLVLVALAAGVVAVELATHAPLAEGIRATLDGLALTHVPLVFSERWDWIPGALGVLGLGSLLAVAYAVFRPLAPPLGRPPPAPREDARELVRAHGTDTLSFFKLREDKHLLFSPDRRAFVGYRVEGGVLLVSGDPVGPADALEALIVEIRAFADVRGLKLAVLGASEEMCERWRREGLRGMYIGDEAVVDAADFSLEGRPIRKIRQSVTRLVKAGYRAELELLGDLDAETCAALEHVSACWRDGKPERGFSMAMDGLHGAHQDECPIVIARDEEGRIRGFLHFVPVYGRPAVSLGFMRREHDTPNGLTEFLVVRAIELLRDRGVEEVSLNFAAFARWMHAPAGRRDRLLARIVALGNPFFQIESLYRFNAKFFPRWVPRFLVFEGPLGLPRASVAALWAEGQLPKPRLRSSSAV